MWYQLLFTPISVVWPFLNLNFGNKDTALSADKNHVSAEKHY